MALIRYQAPELAPWEAADRWSNLRDDLNSFFELPFWSSFGRGGQLFTGWSPALDLYQNNDNVVAVIELPGMRKEEIEISLHDGTLTISGERTRESSSNDENNELTITGRRSFPVVEGTLIHRESRPENFRRTFELDPSIDADKINAKIDQGLVRLTLPKAEHVKPRKITVS